MTILHASHWMYIVPVVVLVYHHEYPLVSKCAPQYHQLLGWVAPH